MGPCSLLLRPDAFTIDLGPHTAAEGSQSSRPPWAPSSRSALGLPKVFPKQADSP